MPKLPENGNRKHNLIPAKEVEVVTPCWWDARGAAGGMPGAARGYEQLAECQVRLVTPCWWDARGAAGGMPGAARGYGTSWQMYRWYALLDQRPRCLMRWSGMPAVAAVVAAPIRKLWVLYEGASKAARDNMSLVTWTTS